jgi:hypothetical protein
MCADGIPLILSALLILLQWFLSYYLFNMWISSFGSEESVQGLTSAKSRVWISLSYFLFLNH